MGENAEMLLDGTLDFYTGDYLGQGYGFPRTYHKSLRREKRRNPKHTKNIPPTKEQVYNGVKNYISIRWTGRKDIPSVRVLIMEYTGEQGIDLKQKCLEIQKDFGSFIKFINQKLKK